MKSGVRGQPGQHGEAPSPLKIQILVRQVPVIPATREAEAGELLEPGEGEVTVSRDHATALQPGQQGDSVKKKKKSRESPIMDTRRKPDRRILGRKAPSVLTPLFWPWELTTWTSTQET